MRNELLSALSECQGRKILVVGDVMLDEHVWSTVSRVSPEAPIPVAHVMSSSYAPGGAANVANNICALGGTPILVGLIGRDNSGQKLISELEARGVNAKGLVVDENRPTTLKTRIIAHTQQLVRVDREETRPIEGELIAKIIEIVQQQLKEVEVVVISDYDKGVVTPKLCREIISTARRAGKVVIVDPKPNDYTKYRGTTIITPNLSEAELATRLQITDERRLLEAAQKLLKDVEARWVLITRGAQGMSLVGKDGECVHIPAMAAEVYDVSGAGDTVVGTLGLALAAGAEIKIAAMLANQAAGLVVARRGVATVTAVELKQALADSNKNTTTAKIRSRDEIRNIREQLNREGKRVVSTNGCFDILHLGHIKYLEEAKSFGDVLVVGINSDESARRLKGEQRPLFCQEERAQTVAALECVDYVTIFSEPTPKALIKALKPDVHIKGGDYRIDDLPEAKVVESYGGKVVIVDKVQGKSTTNIIKLILEKFAPKV